MRVALAPLVVLLTLACGRGDDRRAPPVEARLPPAADAASPVDALLDPEVETEPSVDVDPREGTVLIPAGWFVQGCVHRDDVCVQSRGRIYLDDFYLDRLEVTVAQYRACVDAGRCTPPEPTTGPGYSPCPPALLNWGRDRDDHPVNCVTPQQAETYCRSRGKHLPTEYEWQKAARGTVDRRRYPWGDRAPDCRLAILARSERRADEGCGRRSTWTVGSRPAGASPYGVLDLVGNVAELVYAEVDFVNVDGDLEEYMFIHTVGGGFLTVAASATISDGAHSPLAETGFRCAWVPRRSLEWQRIRQPPVNPRGLGRYLVPFEDPMLRRDAGP